MSDQPKTDQPQNDFITFKCPSCGKSIGFIPLWSGTAMPCPTCKASVMIPAASGGDSFVVAQVLPAGQDPSKAPDVVTAVVSAAPKSGPAAPTAVEKSSTSSRKKRRFFPRFLSRNSSEKEATSVLTIVILFGGVSALFFWGGQELKRATQRESAAASNPPPHTTPTIPETPPAPPVVAKVAEQPETPVVSESSVEIRPRAETKESSLLAGPVPDAPAEKPAETKTVEQALAINDKKSTRALEDEPAAGSQAIETRTGVAQVEPATPPAPAPAVVPVKVELAIKPPEKAPAKAAKPAGGLCQTCLGTSFMPVPIASYVRVSTDPGPNALAAIPWKFCPKCQPKKDAQSLVQRERERISNSQAQHAALEQKVGKMLFVETHHIALYSQLPVTQTKFIGTQIEQLSAHLQRVTGTTLLTQTRPDTHSILMFSDAQGYNKFIDDVVSETRGDRDLMRKATFMYERNRSYFDSIRGAPPEHKALFVYAKMSMIEATDGNCPPWLAEGFAAYCENAITKKNLCWSIDYEWNDIKIGERWDADIRKYVQTGKVKNWPEVFKLDLIGMKALDYLECYSVVSYLIRLDPFKFAQAVVEIRGGADSTAALEKAYGKTLPTLQTNWMQTVSAQR